MQIRYHVFIAYYMKRGLVDFHKFAHDPTDHAEVVKTLCNLDSVLLMDVLDTPAETQ